MPLCFTNYRQKRGRKEFFRLFILTQLFSMMLITADELHQLRCTVRIYVFFFSSLRRIIDKASPIDNCIETFFFASDRHRYQAESRTKKEKKKRNDRSFQLALVAVVFWVDDGIHYHKRQKNQKRKTFRYPAHRTMLTLYNVRIE